MTDTAMSDYERAAYERLTAPPSEGRSLMPRRARETASRVGRSVRSGASKVPGSAAVAEAYAQAAKGLTAFTTGNGIHSVSMQRSVARYRKKGHDVEKPEDILGLDLRRCDETLPNRKRLHEIVALAEGAAASLLITGATVSTTVSGGTTAAVALTTVAADSVVVMAGLGRVVGEVAVAYGFDPNLPEEEVFALQVLGFGLATGSGAKASALASLSRLTQDMMRRATWTQLNEHVLVGVINRAFAMMGLRLTQKKLAQVVPVAGVLVSSGVNLQLLHRVHDAAVQAYRLRFLTVKYGLGAAPSAALVAVDTDVVTWDGEDVAGMDELLREAVLQAEVGSPDEVRDAGRDTSSPQGDQ